MTLFLDLLYRWLGGPQDQFEWVQKISRPPGFNPQITQPVVSRYTDYTVTACVHYYSCVLLI